MNVTHGVATFNLVAQIVLVAILIVGSVLAWSGRRRQHCWVMRTAIVAQLVLVGVIMAPQVGRYYADWSGFSRFSIELIVHHAFAAIALLLAIYVNLAYSGILRRPKRFWWLMRATLAMWSISLGLGVHLFWYLWR
jgi:uncharacterized membrane protein YozB (DUF420 family)